MMLMLVMLMVMLMLMVIELMMGGVDAGAGVDG